MVIAIVGALRPRAFAATSAEEVSNYVSEQFLTEPELWRVHVRSLRMLSSAVASAEGAGESIAKAIDWSLRAFLGGLVFSLLALAILIFGVT